jgi:replicative DNA helicase
MIFWLVLVEELIMSASDQPFFVPAVNLDEVQGVVIGAALSGNSTCLARLPALLSSLDEPYRTVGSELLRLRGAGCFIDRNILGAVLSTKHLSRTTANGRVQDVTAGEVLNLITGTPVDPGQAEAYLDILAGELAKRRQAELKSRLESAVADHANSPQLLCQEIGRIVAAASARGSIHAGPDEHPCELLELIPYATDLERQLQGTAFQGLDSGFQHVNFLCNGLDTGLFVLAAKPGEGKTTLVWQMGCQTAEINQVPVIFFSFEQSKKELRAKALARMSRLQYRHILRGRIRSDDPDRWPQMLDALTRYAQFSQYLTIIEGDDTTTVDVMRDIVAQKMHRAGVSKALVGVDYLQNIPLTERNADRVTSSKDKIDLHVSSLRRMARDLNVSVVCISSENRAGYNSKGMDVFKESGGIEYSADIAAVLLRDKNTPRGANHRGEDLYIVKNRNGECGVIKFRFHPERAEFVETERGALPEDSAD